MWRCAPILNNMTPQHTFIRKIYLPKIVRHFAPHIFPCLVVTKVCKRCLGLAWKRNTQNKLWTKLHLTWDDGWQKVWQAALLDNRRFRRTLALELDAAANLKSFSKDSAVYVRKGLCFTAETSDAYHSAQRLLLKKGWGFRLKFFCSEVAVIIVSRVWGGVWATGKLSFGLIKRHGSPGKGNNFFCLQRPMKASGPWFVHAQQQRSHSIGFQTFLWEQVLAQTVR